MNGIHDTAVLLMYFQTNLGCNGSELLCGKNIFQFLWLKWKNGLNCVLEIFHSKMKQNEKGMQLLIQLKIMHSVILSDSKREYRSRK